MDIVVPKDMGTVVPKDNNRRHAHIIAIEGNGLLAGECTSQQCHASHQSLCYSYILALMQTATSHKQ